MASILADGNGADNDGCDDANDDDIVYVDDENSNDVADIYAFDVAVDVDDKNDVVDENDDDDDEDTVDDNDLGPNQSGHQMGVEGPRCHIFPPSLTN